MQRYKQKKRQLSAKKLCAWEQTFQQGTFDVGEEVFDPGERLQGGDAGSMTEKGLMEPV